MAGKPDHALSRYQSQLRYGNIGIEGRRRLGRATLVVIGLGALGTVAADLAVRAGIGAVHLVDYDEVVEENLPRQTLYTEADVGRMKTEAAKGRLAAANPGVEIVPHLRYIDAETIALLKGIAKDRDRTVILDCTDNLSTKLLVNDYCKRYRLPLVIGTAAGDEGYFFGVGEGAGCLRDVFPVPKAGSGEIDSCSTLGALNTLTASVAAGMATLAYRFLTTGAMEPDVFYWNAWRNDLRRLKRKAACAVCRGERMSHGTGPSREHALRPFCGACTLAGTFDLAAARRALEGKGIGFDDFGEGLRWKCYTLFPNRLIIREKDLKKAEALLDATRDVL